MSLLVVREARFQLLCGEERVHIGQLSHQEDSLVSEGSDVSHSTPKFLEGEREIHQSSSMGLTKLGPTRGVDTFRSVCIYTLLPSRSTLFISCYPEVYGPDAWPGDPGIGSRRPQIT